MNWLTPQGSEPRPEATPLARMWGELAVTVRPHNGPAVAALLEALQHVFDNGGAVFAGFDLAPHPVLDYYASRGQFAEIDFVPHLLSHPALIQALPDLMLATHTATTASFEPILPLTLDGHLAHALVHGGAYTRHKWSAAHAKHLGLSFCRELFDERYDEVVCCQSVEPWSKWFWDIAWDYAWVIIDRRHRRVWLLCATDTD